MNQPLKWLPDAETTPWPGLARAMRDGMPVPGGFVVFPHTPEEPVRTAYEELKIREKTHFAAVRGPSHAVLNVLAADPLIRTVRRFWAESPEAPLLIQRMVHASWCGKAHRRQNELRITANEGMMVFDPDTYVFTESGVCIEREIRSSQRRMIRHVDGSPKTVEIRDSRTGMTEDQLRKVVDLAGRVPGDIAWALDDQDRAWLISVF